MRKMFVIISILLLLIPMQSLAVRGYVGNLVHKGLSGYNVTAYGAKGDGVTDDTAAIQAAIDAASSGSKVIFPPGSYAVSTELLLNKTGITLKGLSAAFPYYQTKLGHTFTAEDGILLKAAGVDDALTVVDSDHDVLVLTSDEGGPVSIDVANGRYNRDDLATALETAMNADGTLTGGVITFVVTYSSATEKFTLDATVGKTIAYTNAGSDGGGIFGFTAGTGAAQTITSDKALPIAVIHIKSGGVTVDGIGIDAEENTNVDYGFWLDGSESVSAGFNNAIYANTIKNSAVVDLFKVSASGIYDGTWFTHIENIIISGIKDGIGLNMRRMNTTDVTTTHTVEKVFIIYCEVGIYCDANTLGITVRDSLFVTCRVAVASVNSQLFFDNCQWEAIGFDLDGVHGFVSDQIQDPNRAAYLEGPIYLNGATAKFNKNQFLYVRAGATGTTDPGWTQHGWFVLYGTGGGATLRGSTVTVDNCEFTRQFDTADEGGYKIARFIENQHGRLIIKASHGLDRLDYEQAAYGDGYALLDQRLFHYEAEPVKFANGKFIAISAGIPNWGAWEIGDRVVNSSASVVTDVKSWICTTAGYNTTIAINADATSASDEITITTPANGNALPVGSYITIAGVTGTKKVIELMTATKRRIDSTADATVAAAAVANAAATFTDANLFDILGDLTLNGVDPTLILDGSTVNDTDYWLGITADEVGNDNDRFEIGEGTTKGAAQIVTIWDNKIGLDETSPAALLHLGGNGTLQKFGDGTGDVTVTAETAFGLNDVIEVQNFGTHNRLIFADKFTIRSNIDGGFLGGVDPVLVYDGSTASDTDYWIGLTADEVGDDNDSLQVGKGITKGTTPFFTWNEDGGFIAQNLTDVVTGYQFLDSDGGTPILNIDTVDERVGMGTAAPDRLLHLGGTGVLFKVGDGTGDITVEAETAFGVDDLLKMANFGSFNKITLGEQVTVNSTTGNVGIGNATPLEQLVVGDGTKHDGFFFRDTAEVQTTDATVTVLDSITLADENVYTVQAFVAVSKSDGAGEAGYLISCVARRTGGGGATVSTTYSQMTDESNAALDATFTVSGTALRLSVTGIAAETWEWGATLRYINISN